MVLYLLNKWTLFFEMKYNDDAISSVILHVMEKAPTSTVGVDISHNC